MYQCLNMDDQIAIFNEDCVTGMAARLESESTHCVITSIPFGALFMYSGKTEDIGNNQDGVDLRAGQFGLHMRFFIEQLYRVMKPGCNVCIHIQQLLRYKVQHGFMGLRDFRGACLAMFEEGGFQPHGEVVICKNPQAIAQRMKLHSLMFVTGKRNARKLAPAVNDYVLFFQKPGECEDPVPALYDRKENPDGWITQDEWIRDAHGVWAILDEDAVVEGVEGDSHGKVKVDIQEIDTLEGWRNAKESEEEKHVCPLQLEVIRRCMRLYTNPGELVLDPFMGIGSTAYVAIEQGRRCVGFELKESYHRMALANVAKALHEKSQSERDLFTAIEETA